MFVPGPMELIIIGFVLALIVYVIINVIRPRKP